MLGDKRATTGMSGRKPGCTRDWLQSSSGFRLRRDRAEMRTGENQEGAAG